MHRYSFINVLLYLSLMALGGCKPSISSELNNISYLDCSPFAWRIEKEEFYKHTKCGTVDEEGLIQLNQEVLNLMDFPRFMEAMKNRSDEDRQLWPPHLQCLPTYPAAYGRGGQAYFNKDGKGRFSPSFDNMCWPFNDDISHTYENGKVVYFNGDLEIVKKTNYRFTTGRIVCSEAPYKYYKPGTYEHPERKGGQCGLIDASFKIVVPIKYSYEDVLKMNKNTK